MDMGGGVSRGRVAAGLVALMVLVALACGLSGCSVAGSPSSQAAAPPAHPTRAPTAVSTSGTWVFKNSYTVETLHLRQGRGGAVSGDGTSAVTESSGKVDHSSIEVHSGHVARGQLTLALYISPLDWGTGLNAVERLRCTVTPRVLHCRMDMPLYRNIRNVKQDFQRR